MKLHRRIEIWIRNALDMPIKYTAKEFKEIKSRLDWDKIPEQRKALLSGMFKISSETADRYIKEAEEIDVDESDPGDGFAGVGSPMGRTDRITLYAALRACKPNIVVETGTAAGASSVYILTALHKNRTGIVHSIDSTKDRTNVARLVPDCLRERYRLYAGNSLTVLDELFAGSAPVDFFLHDSQHTYPHMMAEYEWAWNHTKGQCVLCSHDVLMGNAWQHFVRKRPVQSGIIKNFGVCILTR